MQEAAHGELGDLSVGHEGPQLAVCAVEGV